jgi:hypothetical protein
MTSTQIANLALDLLGEPPLTDLETDTSTTAETVRLHYNHTLEVLLEQHHWAFGTAPANLLPLDEARAATATLNPTGTNNDILITAAATGPDGNLLTAEIATSTGHALTVAKTANHILITAGAKHRITITGPLSPDVTETHLFGTLQNDRPAYYYPEFTLSFTSIIYWTGTKWLIITNPPSPGTSWESTEDRATPDLVTSWTATGSATGTPTLVASPPTAAQAIAAANAALEETFANAPGSDGTGTLAAVPSTPFQGGRTTLLPDWGTAYDLPADCLRVLKLTGPDRGAPITDFRIIGRKLLLSPLAALTDRLHIEYITSDATDWSATFREAFRYLLASRIATRITGSPNLAAQLLQDHRETLARATLKDSQETSSNENNPMREMILRSPLARARRRYSGSPDYTPEPPNA